MSYCSVQRDSRNGGDRSLLLSAHVSGNVLVDVFVYAR